VIYLYLDQASDCIAHLAPAGITGRGRMIARRLRHTDGEHDNSSSGDTAKRQACGGVSETIHDQPGEQTADCRYQSNFRLTPVLLGDQEDIQIRTDRAPNVGKQETHGVE
jgi:hypothetical protein